MTALYIDADACPVKVEAERVATRHKIPMYVVTVSYTHLRAHET